MGTNECKEAERRSPTSNLLGKVPPALLDSRVL
jgi:hypothetical protein